jgi:hypothetical protein
MSPGASTALDDSSPAKKHNLAGMSGGAAARSELTVAGSSVHLVALG